MNLRSRLQSRAAIFGLIAAFSAASPLLTPAAHSITDKLEIWPGRRVVVVLPMTVSPGWNADKALGEAIVPLTQTQLQNALAATEKFSVTLPYRFDPLLRRSLVEKRLVDTEINALVDSPKVETALPVFSKLQFDQPVMFARVELTDLKVGGTPKQPTVQLTAFGELIEQGSPNPPKRITITSRPATGKTPADRIRSAANEIFSEIAAEFVAPPEAFNLLLPPAPADSAAPAAGGPTQPAPGTSAPGIPTPGNLAPSMQPMSPVSPPNPIPSAPGAPLVPVVPGGQPPLGIGAGPEGTEGR